MRGVLDPALLRRPDRCAGGAARARRGLEVIPMHFGQPSEGASPAALEAARAHVDGASTGLVTGVGGTARAIALHYRDEHGIAVAPERILLTTGASAGLVATFAALFAAGDPSGSPAGVSAYRNALRRARRVPVEIAAGRGTAFDSRRRCYRRRANPCTVCLPPARPTRRAACSARPNSARSPPNADAAARASYRTRSTTALLTVGPS